MLWELIKRKTTDLWNKERNVPCRTVSDTTVSSVCFHLLLFEPISALKKANISSNSYSGGKKHYKFVQSFILAHSLKKIKTTIIFRMQSNFQEPKSISHSLCLELSSKPVAFFLFFKMWLPLCFEQHDKKLHFLLLFQATYYFFT